jgi:hypothetical protein
LTLVAFVLSVLLGTGSLAYAYLQAGQVDLSRWFVWIGVLWILAHWRKVHRASSPAFLLIMIGAAYGVWNGFTTIWMLFGALGGLLGWDLSDFARRLSYAAPTDEIRGMERRHLTRVGVVASLGLGLVERGTPS